MVNYKNIYINQGSSYVQSLTLLDDYSVPLNLLNYDVQARMSRSNYAKDYIVMIVTSSDPANGVIELSLTSEVTSDLRSYKYVYEVVAIDAVNNVSKLLEGLAILDPGVGLSSDKYVITY